MIRYNRFIYGLLTLLLVYCGIDFIINAKQDFFILNYTWNQSSENPIGKAQVLDYDIDVLQLSLFNDFTFDTDQTYVLNKKHYFRVAHLKQNERFIDFRGIQWINEYPKFLNDTIILGHSNIKLNQGEGTKIAMVGDSQMGWRGGKYTRKRLSEKLHLNFIGDSYDVFGYPYFYRLDLLSNELANLDNKLKDAEIIILYLGLREELPHLLKNIKILSIRHPDKPIILINSKFSSHAINDFINVNALDNVEFLDISNFKQQESLFEEGQHLNLKGHNKLSTLLISKLKSLEVEKI